MKNWKTSTIAVVTVAALLSASGAAVLAKGGKGHGGKGVDFSTLDADGDGFVTMAELEAGRMIRFQEQDANGDGNLTQDELKAAMVAKFEEAGRDVDEDRLNDRLGRMFRAMDENSDGNVTFDELPQRDMSRMFERLDEDGDGKISQAEADAAKDKRKGKGGRKGDKQKDEG